MQEEVSMTYRELDRLTVIKQVISGNITQRKASEVLKVSERQVRRLQRCYLITDLSLEFLKVLSVMKKRVNMAKNLIARI
ncbi:MAG: helix-turn-helix domain-containing protein [Gammaproteobacteria bacterium]